MIYQSLMKNSRQLWQLVLGLGEPLITQSPVRCLMTRTAGMQRPHRMIVIDGHPLVGFGWFCLGDALDVLHRFISDFNLKDLPRVPQQASRPKHEQPHTSHSSHLIDEFRTRPAQFSVLAPPPVFFDIASYDQHVLLSALSFSQCLGPDQVVARGTDPRLTCILIARRPFRVSPASGFLQRLCVFRLAQSCPDTVVQYGLKLGEHRIGCRVRSEKPRVVIGKRPDCVHHTTERRCQRVGQIVATLRRKIYAISPRPKDICRFLALSSQLIDRSFDIPRIP